MEWLEFSLPGNRTAYTKIHIIFLPNYFVLKYRNVVLNRKPKLFVYISERILQ